MGHLVAECPSIRVGAFNAAGPKCYNCQQFGHIARSCPNAPAAVAPVDGVVGVDGAVAPVAAVVPPVAAVPRAVPLGARIGGFAGRGGFAGARGGFMGGRPGRCYGCGGFGHQARNCPTAANFGVARPPKTCYKCQQEGHIARDCPLNVVAPIEPAVLA
ncbi:gig suppressor [Rhodotorula kratochvilovae]